MLFKAHFYYQNTAAYLSQKIISEIRHEISAAENCLKTPWKDDLVGSVKIHPDAPFHQLSRGLSMLLNGSDARRLLEMCAAANQSPGNLRVLMINSRVKSFSQRKALRETYLPKLKRGQAIGENKNPWVYFFAISRPSSQSETDGVHEEIDRYGDVIVFNTPEGYDLTPLKILSAMKLAFCYCPSFAYFMKSDDDTYSRIGRVDAALRKLQNHVDMRNPGLRVNWTNSQVSADGHVPLNTAGMCQVQRTPRNNHHHIPFVVIPSLYLPFESCTGQLSIWARPLIQNLIQKCAQHCVGFYGDSASFNFSRPCFWRPEDLWLGSCVHAYFNGKKVTKQLTDGRRTMSDIPTEDGKPGKFYAENIIIRDRKTPEMLREAHSFFEKLDEVNKYPIHMMGWFQK